MESLRFKSITKRSTRRVAQNVQKRNLPFVVDFYCQFIHLSNIGSNLIQTPAKYKLINDFPAAKVNETPRGYKFRFLSSLIY
jgi:hypothetical protein